MAIGNSNLFDQAKFYAGLAIFGYAVWSLGAKRAGQFGYNIPGPEQFLGGIPGFGGGGYPAVRSTPNCDSRTKRCSCPDGDQFQMGPARTCKDCAAACAKKMAQRHGPPARSNIGLYWGRPWRDSALPWTPTGWEKTDANRLTVA